MTLLTARPDDGPDATAPAATRSRRPGWRNPRLVLGLLLVAGSVVVGARVLAAGDDSVGVWALTRDVPAGTTLAADDLERRQVRFPDARTADGYVGTDDPAPRGRRLAHEIGAGELLPRSALAAGPAPDLVEVPVSVAGADLPATVHEGSHVDVWVTPRTGTTTGPRTSAVPVLSDVVVVAVPRPADSLAPQETRQVVVGVPRTRVGALGAALGGMSEGHVVIARRG